MRRAAFAPVSSDLIHTSTMMFLHSLLSLLASSSLVLGTPIQSVFAPATAVRQTMDEAAVSARQLLSEQGTGTISTLFSLDRDDELQGSPFGLMEVCSKGSLVSGAGLTLRWHCISTKSPIPKSRLRFCFFSCQSRPLQETSLRRKRRKRRSLCRTPKAGWIRRGWRWWGYVLQRSSLFDAY